MSDEDGNICPLPMIADDDERIEDGIGMAPMERVGPVMVTQRL